MIPRKLTGQEVFDILLKQGEEREAISWHFSRDSQVWRKIQEHITKAEDCVLVNKPGPVVISHGSSGISFRKINIYGTSLMKDPQVECETFELVFEATYWNEEDERELDRLHEIRVPIKFLKDFKEKEFHEWIGRLKAERDSKKYDKDMEQLKVLVAKYPHETKTFSQKD
jgi:hypothetical protein